jgi:hypothetical protein
MFAELEADFGSAFHLEQGDTESKALLIVLHLDWLNDDVYDSDVKDLLG